MPDTLALVPLPNYPVLRHLHYDPEPLNLWAADEPSPTASSITTVDQRLDRFRLIDGFGIIRDWYTARRCECGFEPYTAPVRIGLYA